MALRLLDLDDLTRMHMLAELELDITNGKLYMGRYLSQIGKLAYPVLLREAISAGDDASLAAALDCPENFVEKYERRKPGGGTTLAKVPYTAPMTLAEGEFNRFYLRGVCQRLLVAGEGGIEIYRARPSENPRSASEAMLGKVLEPSVLLNDLRTNTGVDTALGLPPGPNSGLSGRIAGSS